MAIQGLNEMSSSSTDLKMFLKKWVENAHTIRTMDTLKVAGKYEYLVCFLCHNH